MTLLKLKDKWFIDVATEGQFPPQARHPGTAVKPYTDGNLVELLIDGKAIMGDFHYRVQAMLESDSPADCSIWVAAMGIDPVKLLGENGSAKDAKTTMLEAAEAGVNVCYLGSGQGNLGPASKKFGEALIARGSQGAADKRFPGRAGGHHQKLNVTRGPDGEWAAIVSSADFFFARWDTPDHRGENADRPKAATHDVGLKVRGPAVHDIGLTFVERWNDASNRHKTEPQIGRDIATDFLDQPIAPAGPHSVQVLRSYPLYSEKEGPTYSWSHQGEYTIWAAYLNALKQAREYIYIEDQYLYTFGDPPFVEAETGLKRETDLVYQMGEALKRGVDVVAVTPGRNNAIWKHYEIQQRRRAATYLQQIADSHPGAGRVAITYLHKDDTDPTVHSKLLLVDDEYAMVGTANICQRSIGYISEIMLGVVDAENKLVRDMRLALWQEHLELPDQESLVDARQAVQMFYDTAAGGNGRLRLQPSTRPRFEVPYRAIMNKFIDPYLGPPRE